jgi:beta-lactamase superfamily II metal-dependent hydrolase
MPSSVEVHILGANRGESIILKLPNGGWGVVDCFCPQLNQPETNSTVRFLRQRQIRELEFFCLTHPHDDHVRGASYIANNFRIKRFWTFGGFTPHQLIERVCAVLQFSAASSHNSQDIQALANDLVETFRTFRLKLAGGETEIVRLVLGLQLWEERINGTLLRVFALGPSGRASAEYEDQLKTCFDEANPRQVRIDRLPRINHNLISSGLLIEFGAFRAVLGGDILAQGWEEALAWRATELRFESDVVKVSHHGSTNGYCPLLWENHLSPRRRAVAVVTAFSSQHLPRPEGLQHIQAHAKSVFTPSISTLRARARANANVFDEFPAEARILLQQVFTSARPYGVSSQGMCSVRFEEGQELQITCSGDASVL